MSGTEDTTQLSLDQTPEGWDAVVADFERTGERLTSQFVEQALRMAGVGPGQRVLDVAAGTGAAALAAAHLGAEVLATDFAPKMVERLGQRASELGLTRVSTRVMDGQALDLPDGSFDSVCSNFGVIFFPDPDLGFQEMHRVLKPGGQAVVTAWSWAERFEPAQVIGGAIRRAFPDLGRQAAPVWLRFQDPDVLRRSFERAGFVDVYVETVGGSWSFPSIDWMKENLLKIAPAVQAMFAGFSDEQQGRILDEMGLLLSERFGEAEPVLSVEAHITVATKGQP